jgi:hypothetical protein
MSWRDETPQEVQDDLDQLADESLSAATAFLEKSGELYPFGFRLPLDGGPALALLLPYRRSRLRRSIEFGDLVATPGERRVWRRED